MSKLIRIAFTAALALTAMNVRANDEELVARMVKLDESYINPLFFTSNAAFAKSKATLMALRSEWTAFAADYRTYRPAEANWSAHFDAVEAALSEAEAIVYGAATQTCGATPTLPCPAVVPAHDALEAIRYEMRDLRRNNGFPKFFTDKLTAYHDPMEAIVLSVKNAAVVDEALMLALDDSVKEAQFLWSLVEKCPIDEAWGLAPNQLATVQQRIAAEGAALDAFAAALAARDVAAVQASAMPIKQAFVPVYTSFASDPLLNKLPAPIF